MASTPKWKDAFDAAEHNDLEAIKYFVEKKPRVLQHTNEEEKSVALIAAMNNNFTILKYVLETDDSLLINGDMFGNNIIQRVIEHGALDTVKYLVEQHHWDVHRRNNRYFGNTPIHHAAEEGQMEILKYLVEERHGDVNVRNNQGDPPLFVAAETPFMKVIKYLVEERGADVMATNNENEHILYVSAVHGDDLTVPRYLLDERKVPFDINWRNNQNYTVLYLATRHNRLSLVKYLVREKHANVNIVDDQRRSALHGAAFRNNRPICEVLIEHGGDLRAKDEFGNTPVEDATDEELVKYLQEMAQKRSRRSVVPRTLDSWRVNTIENDYVPRKRVLGAGTNQGELIESNNYAEIDNFLVIANTIMRYSRGSLRRKSADEALLSPAEIVQSKMDPLAVDAIREPPQ